MKNEQNTKTARDKGGVVHSLIDCLSCANWFLGCLNGRKIWKDKAIMPNLRSVGKSGKEYTDEELPEDKDEYPLRTFCDNFFQDPRPERQGRVIF